MSLFEKINIEYDTCPIVLVDVSGSTDYVIDDLNKTIQKAEMNIIKRKLEQANITTCHLVFWATRASIVENVVNVSDLENNFDFESGGTNIAPAFRIIPNEWTLEKPFTDIYILTDGEIGDEANFNTELRKFMQSHDKVRIKIITVESNNKNYNEISEDCDAGGRIFSAIQNNKLTTFVESFHCYNKTNMVPNLEEPYVNFTNSYVKEGWAEFQNQQFLITRSGEFFEHIQTLIEPIVDSEQELLRLAYDISRSLYYVTKSKPERIREQIIKLYTMLFDQTMIKDNAYMYLSSEINNHLKGTSQTFQEYRSKRQKLFERANSALNENAQISMAAETCKSFITAPVLMSDNSYKIFVTDAMCEPLQFNLNTYNNAGVIINNHCLPLFPTYSKSGIQGSNDFQNQCTRQWIRSIYSRIYLKHASDDMLLYLFLTDMLRIYLSPGVSKNTKISYMHLANIMLDRRRYNSGGVKEIDYLLEGILQNCAKEIGFVSKKSTDVIDIHTLWYGIVLALENDKLINKQIPVEFNDKHELFLSELRSHLENNNALINGEIEYFETKLKNNLELPEYFDYLTQEDCSETGGYAIPVHYPTKNVCCNVQWVLTAESWQLFKSLDNTNCTKCPVCNYKLDLDTFVLVKCKPEFEAWILAQNNNDIDLELELEKDELNKFNWKIFHTENFEKVNIETILNENLDLTVREIDDYNYWPTGYKFNTNIPLIVGKMSNSFLLIKSSVEFTEKLTNQFDFLTEIDMRNICVAGGFCRSLMMNQTVNDIDLYMYDLNKDEKKQRIMIFIQDIKNILSKRIKNSVFMVLYKKNHNVLELLCLQDDLLDSIAEEKLVNLNDLDVEIDEIIDIDDDIGDNISDDIEKDVCDSKIDANISEKKKYTLDNVSNLKLLYKFQIILADYDTISDIFKTFDLDSCCVAYDFTSAELLLNNRSYNSYKYMINPINLTKFSDMYDIRLLKYFDHGFSPLLTNTTIAKIKQNMKNNMLVLSSCVFDVELIESNLIIAKSANIDYNILSQFDIRDQDDSDDSDNESDNESDDEETDEPESRKINQKALYNTIGDNSTLGKTIKYIKQKNAKKKTIHYSFLTACDECTIDNISYLNKIKIADMAQFEKHVLNNKWYNEYFIA
jgi:hypothetical protein